MVYTNRDIGWHAINVSIYYIGNTHGKLLNGSTGWTLSLIPRLLIKKFTLMEAYQNSNLDEAIIKLKK